MLNSGLFLVSVVFARCDHHHGSFPNCQTLQEHFPVQLRNSNLKFLVWITRILSRRTRCSLRAPAGDIQRSSNQVILPPKLRARHKSSRGTARRGGKENCTLWGDLQASASRKFRDVFRVEIWNIGSLISSNFHWKFELEGGRILDDDRDLMVIGGC